MFIHQNKQSSITTGQMAQLNRILCDTKGVRFSHIAEAVVFGKFKLTE
jgi:hypothetical protein